MGMPENHPVTPSVYDLGPVPEVHESRHTSPPSTRRHPLPASSLHRGAVIDEAVVSDARSFAGSSQHREMMGKLEQAFEPCTLPKQNSQTLPHEARGANGVLHREAPSRSGYPRRDRDLSPGGYATMDAGRQAGSRRVLQEPPRSTSPRPPPSAQSSLPLVETTLQRSPHSLSMPNREYLGAYSSSHYAGVSAPSRSIGAGRLLGVVGGEGTLEPRYVS